MRINLARMSDIVNATFGLPNLKAAPGGGVSIIADEDTGDVYLSASSIVSDIDGGTATSTYSS